MGVKLTKCNFPHVGNRHDCVLLGCLLTKACPESAARVCWMSARDNSLAFTGLHSHCHHRSFDFQEEWVSSCHDGRQCPLQTHHGQYHRLKVLTRSVRCQPFQVTRLLSSQRGVVFPSVTLGGFICTATQKHSTVRSSLSGNQGFEGTMAADVRLVSTAQLARFQGV